MLVFDGRLDNREEIKHELLAHAIALKTNTDAELVLASYQLWGEESPKQLLGDFAYAIWDSARQKLFCARDHFGARPFYYTRNEQIFAFASEDEALLGLPGVASQPNEELIAHLLVPGFVNFQDDARSWLQDVVSLLPARFLTVTCAGELQNRIYWELEPGEESVFASDQECEEAFLAVFGEAVRCRMRTVGPVAAMMSGGIDSASIAAMLKRLQPENPDKTIHTFSAIADDPVTCVESQCIESITRTLDGVAHFVSVPSFQGMVDIDDLIDMAWGKAHPLDNSILLPAMMCLAASRQGAKVLLHGASGDLTMDVPMYYSAYHMRTGRWRQAWLECKAATRNNTYLRGFSPVPLFLRNVWAAFAAASVKLLVNWLRSKKSPLAGSAINPDFARKLGLASRLNSWKDIKKGGRTGNLRQIQAESVTSSSSGLWQGLTGYEHVAGRYGVELRDPWADKRVVEFFLRLPLRYKVREGWTKFLARTVFAKDFESHVLKRLGKEHLGWQFASRLMKETHRDVETGLQGRSVFIARYIDIDLVRQRFEKPSGGKEKIDPEVFFDLVGLIFWLERLAVKGNMIERLPDSNNPDFRMEKINAL